jgi:hypothetical protein
MSFDTGDAISRLSACGINRSLAVNLVREIERWITSSGEEWTVKRLKAIKLDYLRHLAGLGPVSTWIRHSKSGKPSGHFGALWKFDKRSVFKCWNALMVYTGISRSNTKIKMTEKQYIKFIKALYRPEPSAGALTMGIMLIDNAMFTQNFSRPILVTGNPLLGFVPSETKRAPLSYGSGPEVQGVLDSIGTLAMRPQFTNRYMEIFSGVLKGIEPYWDIMSQMTTIDAASKNKPLVGAISWIQDPGYKLRFVANPFRVYQKALEPLSDYLYNLLRSISTDCTFDQDSGVTYAQSMIKSGRVSHCFDLSNATDHLPMALADHILKRLGVPEVWRTFSTEVSHGDWNVDSAELPPLKEGTVLSEGLSSLPHRSYKEGGGISRLQWKVGQPLGVKTSFAFLALTHNFLLQGICVLLGKPYDFRILGDDLIIFDSEVAHVYQLVMGQLGVPISEEKTLVSKKVGEFAGRIIFPDNILRGYKWGGRGDNSFIDVARNLGPNSLRLFKRRQVRILKILGSIPEPWGFGWNPEGLAFWDRLSPWLEALERKEVRTRSYTSKTSLLNTLLYNSRYVSEHNEGLDPSLASDQEVQVLLDRIFKYNPKDYPMQMLPNVEYLLRLIDDGGTPPAVFDDPNMIGNTYHVLHSFSQLEKATEITELIRMERLLLHHTQLSER